VKWEQAGNLGKSHTWGQYPWSEDLVVFQTTYLNKKKAKYQFRIYGPTSQLN